MAETASIPAWILLFMGLYALGAGVGEFRQPGIWKRMVGDFDTSPAMRFLTGIVCLALGAAIYLVNPWDPSDWMAILITVLGGWIALEGLLFLAVGDRFIALSSALMAMGGRIWAMVSIVLGIAAIIAALLRL
jgi:uncharacterized protein YjeT (DUF2065 family)